MQSEECDDVLLIGSNFGGEINVSAQFCYLPDLLLRETVWRSWVH